MARRKKGRPVTGWLIVDKPAGMTSTAVVNKAKWALQAQKAGHAGTLDPAATGLLAIAFGEATKTVPYVTDDLKCYEFTVRWGQATNTDDAEGEVIETLQTRPERADIEAALGAFVGDIQQVPPKFSAVKIDGQRAYKLARDGEDVELAARALWVENLDLVDCPDEDHARLQMVCGKGGYVRSIARDLGQALGCLGHVVTLRRLWSGPFTLEGAVTFTQIEELAQDPALDGYLMPLTAGLSDLPEFPCRIEEAARMRNGNPGEVLAANAEYGDTGWASCDGEPIAIGIYRSGTLHPSRVFVAPD